MSNEDQLRDKESDRVQPQSIVEVKVVPDSMTERAISSFKSSLHRSVKSDLQLLCKYGFYVK